MLKYQEELLEAVKDGNRIILDMSTRKARMEYRKLMYQWYLLKNYIKPKEAEL